MLLCRLCACESSESLRFHRHVHAHVVARLSRSLAGASFVDSARRSLRDVGDLPPRRAGARSRRARRREGRHELQRAHGPAGDMLINSEDEEGREGARNATATGRMARKRINKDLQDIGKEESLTAARAQWKRRFVPLGSNCHGLRCVIRLPPHAHALTPSRAHPPQRDSPYEGGVFFSTFNSLRCIPSSRQRCNSPQRSTIQTSTSTAISAWEFWGLSVARYIHRHHSRLPIPLDGGSDDVRSRSYAMDGS